MVSNKVVKKHSYEIHLYIIKLFEFCLNNNYFPREWKVVTINVVLKPNSDHTYVNNYHCGEDKSWQNQESTQRPESSSSI